jgi:hypothetical protein
VAMLKEEVTKEFLEEHYVKQKKGFKRLSKEFGFSNTFWKKTISDFGIPYMPQGGKGLKKNRYLDKVGKWTVIGTDSISEINKNGHRRTLWLCKCECGTERYLTTNNLNYSNSCGCSTSTGYGELSGTFIEKFRGRLKKARIHIEWNLTPKYLWELLLSQNFKCALSGLPITILTRKQYTEYRKNDYPQGKQIPSTSASLDRIDSSIGYIEGNVQWVHKFINCMKREYSQKDFIFFCKRVAENRIEDVTDVSEIEIILNKKATTNKKRKASCKKLEKKLEGEIHTV